MQLPTPAVKLAAKWGQAVKEQLRSDILAHWTLESTRASFLFECVIFFFCTCGLGVLLHSCCYRPAVQLDFCLCHSWKSPAGMKSVARSDRASSSAVQPWCTKAIRSDAVISYAYKPSCWQKVQIFKKKKKSSLAQSPLNLLKYFMPTSFFHPTSIF